MIRHLICSEKLELASELEPDHRDTKDRASKWLDEFNAGKTQLVSFELSNNSGVIDFLNWIGAPTLSLYPISELARPLKSRGYFPVVQVELCKVKLNHTIFLKG